MGSSQDEPVPEAADVEVPVADAGELPLEAPSNTGLM
jgi:hypothetical protein